MIDLRVTNHGSLFLVEPRTDAGRVWLADHTDATAQWFGRGIAVEPRYIDALVFGAVEDGMAVS